MRSRVDAQIKYQLSAAEMLKKQVSRIVRTSTDCVFVKTRIINNHRIFFFYLIFDELSVTWDESKVLRKRKPE